MWQSIAVGIALFMIATGLAKLLGAEKSTPLEQLINSSLGARYAIAFLAVFTAPFIEEFVYRGVLSLRCKDHGVKRRGRLIVACLR